MEIFRKVLVASKGLNPSLKSMLLDCEEKEAKEILEAILEEEYDIFFDSLYSLLPSQQMKVEIIF